MNKEEFLLELEKKLKKLPNEEKETALTYYKEYFIEAGTEQEQEALKEIGTPSEVASQIMANYIVKDTASQNREKNIKNSISTLWIVILAVLASPIALPIALVIITLILVTWIVLIAFWITGVALVLAAVIYFALSVLVLIQDVFLGIFVLGTTMFALGLGIAITIGSSRLFIKYSSWITTKISKFLLRKEKNHEK